jgi:hypothetical protein
VPRGRLDPLPHQGIALELAELPVLARHPSRIRSSLERAGRRSRSGGADWDGSKHRLRQPWHGQGRRGSWR